MKKIVIMVVICMLSFAVCTGSKSVNNLEIKKVYQYNDKNITYHGRTFEDPIVGMQYFNWTCSGFEFKFYGKKLEANIVTQMMDAKGKMLTPWISVFLDNNEIPYQIIGLQEGSVKYTLFESDVIEEHTIRVAKRTEAGHSKTALKAIEVFGMGGISPIQNTNRRKIEFIGDSITCGYGNESEKVTDPFEPEQENGLEAYASKTARKLNADYNCVSISGIGIYSNYTDTNKINDKLRMPWIYDYTDAYLEEWLGNEPYMPWNFESFKPDVIVINLGTNDLSYISYDKKTRIPQFNKHYSDFIKQVRKRNGTEVKIICCILEGDNGKGTLIKNAVKQYKEESKDTNVEVLVFESPRPEDGVGSGSHPKIKTHERMANQLSAKIQTWLGW